MTAAKWKPISWLAKYRGATMWIEEEYRRGPRWGWHVSSKTFDGDGRASSKEAAQRLAVACVDSERRRT